MNVRKRKKSGIRIIELKIESEEDILNIINSDTLEEGPKTRLYNFKREGKSEEKELRCIQKYILYPTLKSYVDYDYTCRTYNKKRKGIYEISVPYNEENSVYGLYLIGKVKAYIDGFLKKDCQICKWQAKDTMGLSFCKLYKKCGKPKYCKENDASKCSMFRINSEVIGKVMVEFNDYLNRGWADIWKQEVHK